MTMESKITWLEDRLVALQKEVDELKALLNGDLVTLPRGDFGEAVTPDEKQGLVDNALIHHVGKTHRQLMGDDRIYTDLGMGPRSGDT